MDDDEDDDDVDKNNEDYDDIDIDDDIDEGEGIDQWCRWLRHVVVRPIRGRITAGVGATWCLVPRFRGRLATQ